MDTLRQDVRYAFRSLRRSPIFAGVVILTLTVGIGALTAIFSVVDSVLLRPLPYGEPQRLVQIWGGTGALPHGPFSSANFLDIRARSTSFDAMAAEDFGWFNLTGSTVDGTPRRLFGAFVTPGFFTVLGVQPHLGRALTADEERPGARVAVVSHSIWASDFASDPAIVGKPVTLNGERYEVVGVMPAGFDFPSQLIGQRIDLWVPLAWAPSDVQRGMRELGLTARLKPGVTPELAQREIDLVARRLAEQYPSDNKDMAIRVVPLRDEVVGSTQRSLYILFGAVALVLLIACANVANLMLGRAHGREKELALRVALGAPRMRIIRQILTEGMVLAIIGGTLGAFAAVWLVDVLVALAADGLPRAQEISVNQSALLFTFAVSLVTGLLFAIGPALSVSGGRFSEALRSTGRAMTGGREGNRLRASVVIAEIALAMVLLVGAGLLVRSFQRLLAVAPGFNARPVLTARLTLPSSKYATDAQRAAFVAAAVEKLSTLPGALSVSAVDYLPFGRTDADFSITVEDVTPVPGAEEPSSHYRTITSNYFDVMDIPLKAGRVVAATDRAQAPLVTVVNEALVRRYWPGRDPSSVLGRRVRIGRAETTSPWLTVVGVVGDVKHWSLDEQAAPELYVPVEQAPMAQFSLVVRVRGEPGALTSAVREALRTIDAEQPVVIRPLGDLIDASVAQPRFRSLLLASFAAVALLLAVIGIYGVISYGVTQRGREIGIRLALGAQRRDIVTLILRQGLILTAAGCVLGLVGSLLLSGLLRDLLFGVTTTDAGTLVVVCVVLATTAALASYLPARRAAKADPLAMMRAE